MKFLYTFFFLVAILLTSQALSLKSAATLSSATNMQLKTVLESVYKHINFFYNSLIFILFLIMFFNNFLQNSSNPQPNLAKTSSQL